MGLASNHAWSFVERLVGRRLLWRAGRSLYLAARRESGNDIATNGERIVQRIAAERARRQGRSAVVLDVGANYGQWASAMIDTATEVGAALRLISFEPVPEIRAALAALFVERGKTPKMELETRGSAVADHVGQIAFTLTEGSATHHIQAEGETGNAIEVPLTTIDEFLSVENITKVDLMKVDCEGYDPLVLKGAIRNLQSGNIAIVQFEYNHCWLETRHFLRDIFNSTKKIPYAFGKVTPHGIEIFVDWSFEMERFFEANYVLVHDDIVNEVSLGVAVFDETNSVGSLRRYSN